MTASPFNVEGVMATRRAMVVTWLVITAVGLGGGSTLLGQAPAVRDSAGVRIVVNPGQLADRVLYRVGAAPLVDIGGLSSDPRAELVSVKSAVRLTNGSLVIAQSSARAKMAELRVFDARGKYVRTIGRYGEGPGELRAVTSVMRLAGDTLVAYDGESRLVYFDSAGRFARSETFTRQLVGRFADGSFLVSAPYVTPSRPRTSLEALYGSSDSIRLHRASLSAPIDNGRPFPNVIRDVIDGVPVAVPHSPQPLIAVGPDRFVFAHGPTFTIGVHARDGKPMTFIRVSLPPVRVRSDEIEREMAAAVVNKSPQTVAMLRAHYAKHALEYPAFSRILLDASRRVWAGTYARFGDTTVRWFVFGPDGVLQGSVPLPAELHLLEIGADHVVGSIRDSDDAPHLRVYRLITPR